MMKPRLLDLFCGAGGCAVGYAQAGFEVVGVDIAPQPHYPYEFIQADALTFPLDGFDVIHASPPCQGYSVTHFIHTKEYSDLLPFMRKRLLVSGKPWIIENVPGAPMHHGIILCGTMFGLKVLRHRYFETSILLFTPSQCRHQGRVGVEYSTVTGHTAKRDGWTLELGSLAMGIDWMNAKELTQAIPPAYTRWIGQFLYDAVMQGREVAI